MIASVRGIRAFRREASRPSSLRSCSPRTQPRTRRASRHRRRLARGGEYVDGVLVSECREWAWWERVVGVGSDACWGWCEEGMASDELTDCFNPRFVEQIQLP